MENDTNPFFLCPMTSCSLVIIEHKFRRDKRETAIPVQIIIMVRLDGGAPPAQAGGARKFEANRETGMVHPGRRSGVAVAICDRGLPGCGSRYIPAMGA
jgi:hypothetical protein